MKLLLLVFSILVCAVFSRDPVCTLSGVKGGVDLTPAALTSDSTVLGRGFWDLIVNICKPVTTKCRDIKGVPALWVFYNDPTNCNRISKSLTTTDTQLEWLDIRNPEQGVVLKYNNGARFEQDGQMVASRTQIKIKCDKDAVDQKPTLESNDVVSGEMVYTLSMASKYACPDPRVSPRRNDQLLALIFIIMGSIFGFYGLCVLSCCCFICCLVGILLCLGCCSTSSAPKQEYPVFHTGPQGFVQPDYAPQSIQGNPGVFSNGYQQI